MKKIINPQMALLAVGVLQPASAAEVSGFLTSIFSEGGAPPSLDEFRDFLRDQAEADRIITVSIAGEPYYALTALGNRYLTPTLRLKRDKFRAYLLRDAHRARFIESRDAGKGLAGVSPAMDTSSGVKGRAPNKLVRPAFGLRFALGRAYWPRIQGQFTRTGPSRQSRDTFPMFLSFASRDQVAAAIRRNFYYDYIGLGTCIGLSPQLVWKIARDTNRHYRSFDIPKKAGGHRTIESPRVFLKAIQWFVADFVFNSLPAHASVHSFSFARSIATNATIHEGQRFVGSIDIQNFFGNVTEPMVLEHLQKCGFDQAEAIVLSKLCCNKGALPQGAPTSPKISNSILFDFDAEMSDFCKSRQLNYTRYSDDITISGESKGRVSAALMFARIRLSQRGLRINGDKTRVASSAGQQRVTGVVVNVMAAPSREYRRRARAIFDQAKRDSRAGIERIPELAGIVGFLKMFPKMNKSQEVATYTRILSDLRAEQRRVIKQ